MKCQNLCVFCRNRCVVEYRHIIEVSHYKHRWFAQWWYNLKEMCRQFFHHIRYSKSIVERTIEHVDFSKNIKLTIYHYTYRPFSVCNCNKRLEEMTEFNPKYWISYIDLKKCYEVRKHPTCKFYKNKGAMNSKLFKFKYRTQAEN